MIATINLDTVETGVTTALAVATTLGTIKLLWWAIKSGTLKKHLTPTIIGRLLAITLEVGTAYLFIACSYSISHNRVSFAGGIAAWTWLVLLTFMRLLLAYTIQIETLVIMIVGLQRNAGKHVEITGEIIRAIGGRSGSEPIEPEEEPKEIHIKPRERYMSIYLMFSTAVYVGIAGYFLLVSRH